MLESLGSFCGNLNLVGIGTFEYVPTVAIDLPNYRYRTVGGETRLTDVPLKSGFSWLSMPILPATDNEQFYDEQPNGDGTMTANINLILPINTPSVRKTLNDMRVLEKFLVRLTDRNGEKFVLGSYPFPLFFSSGFQSNRAAHTLKFSGRQPHLALGFNF